MNATIRRIAVSGSAAVALLGGATAITVADSDTASATEIQSVIDRAAGAPVNMPDGRTVHVRGLDSAAYKANPGHYTATVALASATTDTGSGNDITPNGGVAPLQNPVTGQVPAGYSQQIQTQASGGAVSLTVAVGLGLLIVVIVMVKKGSVKAVQAVACVALGVYLAPTFVGPLVTRLGVSLGSSLGNVWSSF